MAVDGIESLVLPEILNDPVIFPDNAQLQNAELTLSIPPHLKPLYEDIWASFMEGIE
jgi:hypothetical protein